MDIEWSSAKTNQASPLKETECDYQDDSNQYPVFVFQDNWYKYAIFDNFRLSGSRSEEPNTKWTVKWNVASKKASTEAFIEEM